MKADDTSSSWGSSNRPWMQNNNNKKEKWRKEPKQTWPLAFYVQNKRNNNKKPQKQQQNNRLKRTLILTRRCKTRATAFHLIFFFLFNLFKALCVSKPTVPLWQQKGWTYSGPCDEKSLLWENTSLLFLWFLQRWKERKIMASYRGFCGYGKCYIKFRKLVLWVTVCQIHHSLGIHNAVTEAMKPARHATAYFRMYITLSPKCHSWPNIPQPFCTHITLFVAVL